MSDFKDRLSIEQTLLNDKIKKLAAFINSAQFDVTEERQRVLLELQLHVMNTYSKILYERIKILE